MTKVTSWDKTYNHTSNHSDGDGITTNSSRAPGKPKCRCVAWPEGAPDPSTVPHAGEKVRVDYLGDYSSEAYDGVVENGIPQEDGDGGWCVDVRDCSGLVYCEELPHVTRIPDAPTIEIGGKRHRESDVIARCAELEVV